MKHIVLSLVILFISKSTLTIGQIDSRQSSLPDSRRSSAELLVYKLNPGEARDLYLKGKELEESMLHTFVVRCAEAKDIPPLPRGNYIRVRTVDNKLEYSDHTVDNFYYKRVSDEKMMLFLSDTLGNVIRDAVVKNGARRLSFDETTQTYIAKQIGNGKKVEVNNNGVLHYIEVKGRPFPRRQNFFKRSWTPIKNVFYRIFNPDLADMPDKYGGFLLFSKPKYKPGETVRFKAYIEHKGKPYNKEVGVLLRSFRPQKMDSLLTTLHPYRPGMYEWEFPLSDSLKLFLDTRYIVSLKTGEKHANEIGDYFIYEEYELGRVTFEAKTERNRFVKGDTVTLQFNAKDENDMPVYDGRVDITVRPVKYRQTNYYTESTFIPDDIWSHSFDMSGNSTGDLVLPDSIFIQNVGMYYTVECSFLDSSNEKKNKNLTIYMDMRDRLIDFSIKKGILTIKEVADGESLPAHAFMTAYNSESGILFRDSVSLPYSSPLLWMANSYEVTTKTSSGQFFVWENQGEILEYRFFREGENIRLIVDNPSAFPFWYTIRKGKMIIDRGYTTELDYSYKDKGKNGYTMQLSYLSGRDAKTITGRLPYVEKNLSMEVNTPTTVYPGQTARVDLLVKDKKGKPVKNADITAYAFTSKFGSHSPRITVYGKSLSGKQFNNSWYNLSKANSVSGMSPMEWSIWRERMGLDSIEYYKFLYPEISYSYSERSPEEETQIAPYVVIDGALQGVHILWIDGQPYYFSQARQFDPYSFPVTPGYHTLKFRTYDREITVENLFVPEGMKTILSVNGEKSTLLGDMGKVDSPPLQLIVKKYNRKNRGALNKREMELLEESMITVENSANTTTLSNDKPIYMPVILNVGGIYYWVNSAAAARRYDRNSRSYLTESILTGPFPDRKGYPDEEKRGTMYINTAYINTFDIEGGIHYGIAEKSVTKLKWGEAPFSSKIEPFTPQLSFSQHTLTPESIKNMFHARLLERVQQNRGLIMHGNKGGSGPKAEKENFIVSGKEDGCQLKLEIGNLEGEETAANPLMIRLSSKEQHDSHWAMFYGNTRTFNQLPEGDWQVELIFKDTTRYAMPVTLQRKGLNYLKIGSIRPVAADSIGESAFDLLYSHIYAGSKRAATVPGKVVSRLDSTNYAKKEITGRVIDSDGIPIPGVTISVEGESKGSVSDTNGMFRLKDLESGNLLLSFIGYESLNTPVIRGYDYQITMEEIYDMLDEVVVVAFGSQKKESTLSSISTVDPADLKVPITGDLTSALAGRMGGVIAYGQSGKQEELGDADFFIRGVPSANDMNVPLIILNGLPYDGALSDLDPANIASMNVVKDADTAIYGSRAAHGVIFIETKDGSLAQSTDENGFPEGWSSANALRTNFHDDAFWEPRLSTGSDGTASFEVTYPDDITSWNANFIAVGGRKQTDKTELKINSFKPLNAQLSMPQFAILNDSLSVIGRLTNHLGDTVRIKRTIVKGGESAELLISLLNSHIDTIPLLANQTDSINVTYSMTMESGYFDGERRNIPVYQPGVLESHGEFAVLNDSSIRQFQTNPALGSVTLHAQSTAIQSFLDEIERIDRYPYFCNEQIASKIKALLLKKRILPMLGKEFKEDNKVRNLIRRLEKNKNSENLWGWWNQDKTELWISGQIVEAMLDAESDGFKVNFNKQVASDALLHQLTRRLSTVEETADDLFVKHELLNLIELLRKLDAKIDYDQYARKISSLPDFTTNDKLRSMRMRLLFDSAAINSSPQIDSLLSLSSETMLGSLYWAEKEKDFYPGHFMLPHISHAENTLIAYHILREIGGNDTNLEKIRNYFFEIRRNGSWKNIYESTRIMESILPDMTTPGNTFSDASLTINGKEYKELPLSLEYAAGEMIEVRKKGTAPLFFTLYQQAWNSDPEKVSEGFTVETTFSQKGEPVSLLEAGKSVDLQVCVGVDADANYVMIEVPIPAGCSYESKGRGNFWKETHREYYKEKVVIFCHNLSEGSHDFTIKLIPRYTGRYHLNPAKAELMYFPTFFGRGLPSKCDIK